MKCGYGATCEVEKCVAKCVCNDACTTQYAPVCGTDGITYSNECFLRLQSCKTQTHIKVAREEKCGKTDLVTLS